MAKRFLVMVVLMFTALVCNAQEFTIHDPLFVATTRIPECGKSHTSWYLLQDGGKFYYLRNLCLARYIYRSPKGKIFIVSWGTHIKFLERYVGDVKELKLEVAVDEYLRLMNLGLLEREGSRTNNPWLTTIRDCRETLRPQYPERPSPLPANPNRPFTWRKISG